MTTLEPPSLGPPAIHPWFAVHVRSNRERLVSLHLKENGYEEFSPSYRIESQWSDRKKMIDHPLLPGYVFCRLNPHNRLPVLQVPGVIGLVGIGKTPEVIPEQELARVRALLGSGLLVTPWPFLEVGQRVLIERGPLAGLEGILQTEKGKFRLVVSVTLLQRSVSAEIDRSWVRPLNDPPSKTPSKLIPKSDPMNGG